MNKIKYLKEFLEEIGKSQDYKNKILIIAFINSLSSKEACSFFDTSFEQLPYVRRYLLKKISEDIQVNYKQEHENLINVLLKKAEEKSFSKKKSCAYVIHHLFQYVPKRKQSEILDAFIESKYSSFREKAVRILYDKWDSKYEKVIWNMWNKYNDDNCMKLILEKFPVSFLSKKVYEFTPYLEDWEQRRLFIKIAAVNKKIITDLKKKDPITYTYILVKNGKKLSRKKAWNLIKKYHLHEKITLLLWCFGKMGLWDVLVKFKKKYFKELNINRKI